MEDPEEGIRGDLGLRLLHSSSESLVDIIFVHGLRGGSIKTWRKGSDPRYFWPQSWLPVEMGFEKASIYSFGYDSDWGASNQSGLNVHDFGRSLFEEMRSSHELAGQSPIILVGHSMGGLVIKKALILAHQDAHSSTGHGASLAERIRSIFFLATPHRGSDFAAMLKNILRVSRIPKEYVADLISGSTSTQTINEDFPQYTARLSIFSFYETLPMGLGGVASGIVVDKSSAVLGLREERSTLMHASHRDICKFDSKDDSNYLKLRNALSSSIEELLSTALIRKQQEAQEDLRIIEKHLATANTTGNDYIKSKGSCDWILERDDFVRWRDISTGDESGSSMAAPTIYWVYAGPGAGKTVLASHVMSHLAGRGLGCACYYFHFGKKNAQTLGGFLRSIAYQMAKTNVSIRQALLAAFRDGLSFEHDDARAIWVRLFKGAIFQTRLSIPQFWVVDAIDECVKYSEFFTFLKHERSHYPLKIFITSRKDLGIWQLFRPFDQHLTATQIPVSNTMQDIEIYVSGRMHELPIGIGVDPEALAKQILAKSGASFLWVRLVMDELRGVCADETIIDVLEDIPTEMVPYYQRIVARIAENEREKHIAQAIVLYVVAAARPISTTELSELLEVDVNKRFSSMADAIETLCGQLVTVNRKTGLVHIIHASAREFLLSDAAGAFRIDRSKAHERLALICLQVLRDRKLARPPTQRHIAKRKLDVTGLLGYAVMQFSEHVYSTSAESDQVLTELGGLLASSNVLTLVELLASTGGVAGLIQMAKNLAAYLDRRKKYTSPLRATEHIRAVEDWSITLRRLAAKFGTALLSMPTSINFLIPPLCPTNTLIYERFGRSQNGICLEGFLYRGWDDSIATLSLGEETTSAVTCGGTSIAIGTESGQVRLFQQRSFQQELTLTNQHTIDGLYFTESGKHLISYTSKYLTLWDVQGNQLWSTRIRSRCLTLSSTPDAIVGITENGRAMKWDISSGSLLWQQPFPHRALDDEEALGISRAPGFAALSPGMEVLALAYRSGPVCLWDFQANEFIDFAVDELDSIINHIAFNPNPELYLLLVAYSGSTLALYDSWSGSLIKNYPAERDTNYHSIACSPDGNTLATLDVLGLLRIWDFETLTPLYEVKTSLSSFRILSFTPDGSNIVDASGSGVRIWGPATLIRKRADEDESISDLEHTMVTGQFASMSGPKITSIRAHPSKPAVFASFDNGRVAVFDSRTGKQQNIIYEHPHGAYITHLAVGTETVASSDVNGIVQIRRLAKGVSPSSNLAAEVVLGQFSMSSTIKQLIFSVSNTSLLVATRESAIVYIINGTSGKLAMKKLQELAPHPSLPTTTWLALPSAQDHDVFGAICNGTMTRFPVDAFDNPAQEPILKLKGIAPDEQSNSSLEIRSATFDLKSGFLVIEVRHLVGFVPHHTLFVFSLGADATFEVGKGNRTLAPLATDMCRQSSHFVGIAHGGGLPVSMLYLDKDSWISSTPVADVHKSGDDYRGPLAYTRHFFVPNDLTARLEKLPPVVTSDLSIVFCLHGNLGIVRNGMKYQFPRTTY